MSNEISFAGYDEPRYLLLDNDPYKVQKINVVRKRSRTIKLTVKRKMSGTTQKFTWVRV